MKIELFTDAKNEHRWRARSDNGNIIAGPQEGYKNKLDMLDTLETLRTEFADAEIVQVEE